MATEQAESLSRSRHDLKTKATAGWVVLSSVLGNFFLSWGLKHQSADLGFSPWPYIRLIFNPWVLLGTTLLILWLLSRMALLSWADLSYVLPVTSVGYIFTAILGRIFFGETVSWQRWAGTGLIVVGTILVGLTMPSTTPPTPPAEKLR
jgi:uncharacterized membrane protein